MDTRRPHRTFESARFAREGNFCGHFSLKLLRVVASDARVGENRAVDLSKATVNHPHEAGPIQIARHNVILELLRLLQVPQNVSLRAADFRVALRACEHQKAKNNRELHLDAITSRVPLRTLI